MTIATNSVLRRILDEVRGYGDDEARTGALGNPETHQAADQVLEVRRSACVNMPPFATSLHFWAYALRGFLATRARPEAFDALAVNALCRPVEPDRIGRDLDDLVARLGGVRSRFVDHPDFRCSYRMTDQSVFVSTVAERANEFVAIFWARPSWLADAHALPDEPLVPVEDSSPES